MFTGASHLSQGFGHAGVHGELAEASVFIGAFLIIV